jgi:hypothetical protein
MRRACGSKMGSGGFLAVSEESRRTIGQHLRLSVAPLA